MIHPKLLSLIPDDGLIIILGRRRSGKSCLAYALLEELKSRKQTYVLKFPRPELLPEWITNLDTLDFPENSIILVDEAYKIFSARTPLGERNRFISDLNGLAGQKGLLIIYITQESTKVDINILRGIDMMLVKALSTNQVRFERRELRNYLESIKEEIDNLTDVDLIKKSTYVSCDLMDKKFEGLIVNSNTPPSFWNEELSKSWAGVHLGDPFEERINALSKEGQLYTTVIGDNTLHMLWTDQGVRQINLKKIKKE